MFLMFLMREVPLHRRCVSKVSYARGTPAPQILLHDQLHIGDGAGGGLHALTIWVVASKEHSSVHYLPTRNPDGHVTDAKVGTAPDVLGLHLGRYKKQPPPLGPP